MEIWTEALRPRNFSELLLSRETREKVENWVKSWESGEPTKNGLLLWGEPGCGKTSTAYAISQEKGWKMLEVNSSDYRNESFLKETAGMYSLYSDLTSFSEPESSVRPMKMILIDEADNIFERVSSGSSSKNSGNEIGGYRTIIDILKTTKYPIIITMNDFWEFQRRSTAKEIISRCEVVQVFLYKRRNDLDYKNAVSKLTEKLLNLCKENGLSAERTPIEEIVRENLPDIRSAINDVESYALSGGGTYGSASIRDTHEQIFETIRSMLKGNDIAGNLKLLRDADVDKDTLVQWISTNGVKECNTMDSLVKMQDLVSRADLLSRLASRTRNFRLWIYVDDLVASAFTVSDKRGGYTKYEFPNYIMAMSKSRKIRNAIDRVCRAMEIGFHISYTDAIEMRPYFKQIVSGMKNPNTELSLYLNDIADREIALSMLTEKRKSFDPVTPDDLKIYLS
ncbi:AAA family ATPase [Cuniculiplasma sp. SKW4]|uniref:AAA family ATPase n=1 Tax=Cuniculiplasma sp. SKW4 TaxID=3400171 RepID=UPI003FD26F64